MQIFHSLEGLPSSVSFASLVIGNFDGLHLGHQMILNKARLDAKNRHAPAALLSFEPHPRQFFNADAEPFRLTLPCDKIRLLQHWDWDIFFALPFDAKIAATSADDFVLDILHRQLRASSLFVGADFHFGAKRQGTPDLLCELGKNCGMDVHIIPQLKDQDGIAYSSTFIREALKAGDVAAARQQLGRYWSISGTVFQGDQRGRQLGFPTANIDMAGYLIPAMGVYAIYAEYQGRMIKGIANIGKRPTIGTERIQLEAHLFDFSDDLYGQELIIHLIQFIRPEQKFVDLAALKSQISKDCENAQVVLNKN